MDNLHAMAAVAVMAFVTALLRFLPVLVFGRKRRTPGIVFDLCKVLPYAIMGMLVVYCLRKTTFTSAAGFLPQLIAGALVVATYVWKRNTLVSILVGTVTYMLLVQFCF